MSLNRNDPSDDFVLYGEAYHAAAMALYDKNFAKGTFCDLDVLPMAFLLRHAAELFLKAIVRRGNTLLEFKRQPLMAVHYTHKLTDLFDDVRPVFDFMGWTLVSDKEGFRSFEEFRKCLADLEQDDDLGTDDRQADMWRYPIRVTGRGVQRRDGAAHLPARFNFDVGVFVERLNFLLIVLNNAAIHLDVHLHDLYDQASYDEQGYEPLDYEPPDE